MELEEFVAASDADVQSNVEILRNARTTSVENELSDAAGEIVIVCHQRLNELVPSTRKTKTFFSGMGSRIGNYKNRIKAAKNLQVQRGDVRLIPLAELKIIEHEKTQRHSGRSNDNTTL